MASTEKRKNRLSVVIKMILFSVVVYQLGVVVFLFFTRLFGIELPDQLFGLPTGWISLGAKVLLLAGAATVATKIYLLNPLNEMWEAISEIGRGDFLARVDNDSEDEIGDLARHFNQMLTKLTDLNIEKGHTEYELDLAQEELRHRDFSLLYEIGQRVNSTIEMSELYRVLQRVLPNRLGLQRFAILLKDEKGEFLNVKAAAGFDDPERLSNVTFRIGEGISGEAAKEGELIYLPNADADSRFLHYRGESVERGSFLSIPLKYKRDILGVMNCSRPDKNAFTEEEIRLLTMVANQIALAVENAQLYTKTRELSVRDELTGIYNRRHFQQVLQMEWKRATRFRRPLSLLMIDIDHFKEFNDTFGHLQGDRVLRLIAHLLTRNLREVDTLARFGGEEFVVLLPDTDQAGAIVVGEKLRHLVEVTRFDVNHRQIVPLTISAGISVFPEDAREMDDLIDHADVALYEAKDGGRNRVAVYSNITQISSGATRPTLVRN